MRFDRLTLEKYGAFDQRTLEIGAGAGLTIVYGPNEAGKSTCLAAVGDFLFGIPNNSAHGAIFGYDAMRLEARVVLSDGRSLTLRRRKGRARTLMDETGAPVDEAVLSQLLGSTGRDRFGALFGLNHESLRHGGEQLLAADGEIGRLIVEAGGGLRSLMARLDAIDAEADTLFAPRRSGERAFYKALDAFDTADRGAKASLLTRETFEQTRKAHEAAQGALSLLREERRRLVEETSRLERMVRVAPHLGELARLDAVLLAFDDLGELPADFDERVVAALRDRDLAAAALTESQERWAELNGRIDDLSVDEPLALAEAQVRDIASRLIHITKSRADRPNRLQEIAGDEAKLASLRRRLRLGPDEDLRPRLPSEDAQDQVQALVTQALASRAALESARSRVADIEDEITDLRGLIAAAQSSHHDQPFGITSADLASLPSRIAAGAVRARQAETAEREVQSRVEALGFAATEALRALPCPDPRAVQDEIDARGAIETERLRHGARIAEATAEHGAAQAEILRLQEGGVVPSEAALISARQSRQRAWHPIREAHLKGESPGSDTERADQVTAFEASLTEADTLSDGRTLEARRIASLALAEQTLGKATADIAASRVAETDLAERLDAKAAAFSRAFPEAVRLQPEILALLAFVNDRGTLLDQAEQARLAREEVERATGDVAPLLDLLTAAEAKAGLSVTVDTTIGVRVQSAIQAINRHDAAHADHSRDARDLNAMEASLVGASRLLKTLEEHDLAWRAAWGPAVAALGLETDVTPERAGEMVTQWAGARGVLGSLSQTRRRLERMDADEAELARLLSEINERLALGLPANPVAAGQMLQARWTENDGRRHLRANLVPDLEALKRQIEARQIALSDQIARLQGLADLARIDAGDDQGLRDHAARNRDRTQSRLAREETLRTLASAGDGLDLQSLKDQRGERDIDRLRADLAATADRARGVEDEIETAVQAELSNRLALQGYEAETAFAHASQAREAATAQMHGAIERYIDLTLARDLVSRAINRVRGEQQDPLIRRAGEFFATTTRGEFVGVEADVDDKGQPVVVGARRGGGTVSVATMSDGTRDQLFLAFRLASLETYCTATEPLPFIADDILVHFDDERSTATLELLADFCRTTQVLLFTHHTSIRRASERLVADGRAKIVDLRHSALIT